MKVVRIKLQIFILVLILYISSIKALDPSDLAIIILSQEEGYNAAHAKLLESEIINQAKTMEKDLPKILLTHNLDIYGAWTIVPLITYLHSKNISAHWYVFCTEDTVIRLNKLIHVLEKYDVDIYRNLWVGHALYDKEPTIIHHYAEHTKKFKYPNLSSGFAISKHLLNSLAPKATNFVSSNVDFTIDASYEFSTFILNESRGARLTHISEMCVVSNEDCATYPKSFYPCMKLPLKQNIYVAVKTCAKYHRERLPFIRNTWTKYAENIGFFTDLIDKNIPNSYLVPSTDQGHCIKTYAILKYAAPILQEKKLDWLVITDDDTILSLSRLMKLLTCYNPENAVAIGERYGYRSTKIHGYDYLTGGSGIVLSASLVQQIIKPGVCECPSAITPDDMFLFGVCLAHLNVKVTHSPLFHQARPTDYAIAYLTSQEPISFHKFWMIDPEQVYREWFEEADIAKFSSQTRKTHEEL